MDTVTFLRSVWPSEGHYCIALFHRKGERTWWEHESFDDVQAAARFALARGKTQDTYFTVHALRQPRVWDATKVRGDKVGAWTYRTHANMLSCKVFFGDGDVGPDKPYTTLAEAVLGLKAFCGKTGLPKPTMVKSGRGLHIYWVLDRALPSLVWREHAVKLKQLCAAAGFHLDPSRITDQASVLRVPGTFHLKDPANPLAVVVLHDGGVHDTDEFLATLDRGTLFVPLPGEFAKGEVPEGWGGQPPPFVDLGHACGLVRYAFRNPHEVNEPQWYQLLGLVRHVQDGPRWCHNMSKGHPDYVEAETDAKLHQLNVAAGGKLGPTTCAKMADVFGGETCAKCWYKGHPTSSPLAASRRLPKKNVDPGIPDPPAPWSRIKDGGILFSPDDGTAPRVICEYDLYPKIIVRDELNKRREIVWVIDLPNTGLHEFSTAAGVIYDGKQMQEVMANAVMFTDYDNLKYIRQYMSAYIKSLQKHAQESEQQTHLGWTPDYKSFIMPDKAYISGGTRPAVVSASVANASQYIRREGSLNKQVELMKFYDKSDYVRQQFFIACGLASILFYATGHYGVICNLTGNSGASKSTSLYTAAGFWGDPMGFALDGTSEGQTIRARQARVHIQHNLPVMIDEITLMARDEARTLAMAITQRSVRGSMGKDQQLRKTELTQKSSIMMTTSNNSLHELISGAGAAGTAGAMRVFEVGIDVPTIDSKRTADEYMRGIKTHFGHIGPEFLSYVLANQDTVVKRVIEAVAEIDALADASAAERFWSGLIGATMTAVRIAFEQGLLPFKPAIVEAWVLKQQFGQMRNTVQTAYSDPVDIIMAYVAAVAGDLLVVKNGGTHITRAPSRDLIGRLETDTKHLYVSMANLKNHCLRGGIPLWQTIGVLERMGVATRSRIVLGRGTPQWSLGQVQTLQLDLNHVALAGRPELVQAESNVVQLKRG